MNVIETGLIDAYILEPKVFGDNRGWFMESWSEKTMEDAGFHYNFVQDNHSFSAQKGTLRGLHFQKGDAAQAKLVRACGHCSRVGQQSPRAVAGRASCRVGPETA